MLSGDLGLTDDASAGAWIAPRLHGDFGAVTLQVPSGYRAYVRICHPAADRDGNPATWPQVASATGRTAHALMQWHALVGSPDSLNFTGSLWPGEAFSAEELSRPLLEFPGREYLLFSGPLSAANQIGDPHGVRGFEPQSPNLIWPSDRAWFLASEIDFDSTLVGGSRDLIQAILETPGLDAWSVGPDDSLAYDADRINPIPGQHETSGRDV